MNLPTSARRRRGPLLEHPRAVLLVALVVVTALGILGSGVEGRLSPASLNITGTPSSRANEMLRRSFGNSAPFAILLEGPSAAIDRQGPALIGALQRHVGVTTLSSWDSHSLARLRPGPRRALILVDFHVGLTRAVNQSVPQLERILAENVHPPLRAIQSGFATVSRAIQDESISASEHGELLALPVLLIVLMAVFRSPVAAAIPLGFGAMTVLASRGLLYLLASWVSVDALALTVCTMMGLALGVDYALLMVSRFREELGRGAEPIDAARATRRTAGRTTIFAGATLLLSMIVAVFIVPGSLLASLAGTVAIVVVLSVTVSVVVIPVLLVLIGPNIDRWRIGVAPGGDSRLMRVIGAALRRPAPVAALLGAVVLILAAPAVALKTGSPGPEQLSRSDPARRNIERIYRAIGSGWNAPFQIVATTNEGPITTTKRLATLARAQRRVAALPGVQTVIGPGAIGPQARALRDAGNGLIAPKPAVGSLGKLGGLGRNLDVAAGAVSRLRVGLSQASSGAGLLSDGSGHLATGNHDLSRGLGVAGAGDRRVTAALGALSSGMRQLADAERRAGFGALELQFGVGDLVPNLRRNALQRSLRLQGSLEEESQVRLPQLIAPANAADEGLRSALGHLEAMTSGRSDSEYLPTLEALRKTAAALSGTDPVSGQQYQPGYTGLPQELNVLRTQLSADTGEAGQITAWLETGVAELKKLTVGAKRLSAGLAKIESGQSKLEEGSMRLTRASFSLDRGLARLSGGASDLAGGVSRLGGGASTLREKLAIGAQRFAPLQSGLGRAGAQLISGNRELGQRLAGIRRASPGLFDSGYFVLSMLDGAPRKQREGVSNAIDLRRGGQAASIFVVSKYNFATSGSIAFNRRLDEIASQLNGKLGISAGVAGGAPQVNEYGQITTARIPYVVAAIALATFIALVVVLRALPLAAIVVALNLAVVAVAFGVLTALSNVPATLPLGGHTYVDAVGATIIFGIVFGLSIDYAVFLLIRIKEHHDRDGDNAAAIKFGLEKTARVITGAAAIMMAVFIAFAGAPIATVAQLGIGLTVAVLLDATAVRIVLLPALMLLIGERVWWLPRPLGRVLPRLNV